MRIWYLAEIQTFAELVDALDDEISEAGAVQPVAMLSVAGYWVCIHLSSSRRCFLLCTKEYGFSAESLGVQPPTGLAGSLIGSYTSGI